MGEMSQLEKESMSLGSLVGRNEIAKPWYTKSTMPASIKDALSRGKETTKHEKRIEDRAERKAEKAKRKAEKKDRKRDLKR